MEQEGFITFKPDAGRQTIRRLPTTPRPLTLPWVVCMRNIVYPSQRNEWVIFMTGNDRYVRKLVGECKGDVFLNVAVDKAKRVDGLCRGISFHRLRYPKDVPVGTTFS